MLPECPWYCKDTYATNFRINLQKKELILEIKIEKDMHVLVFG